MDLEEVPILGLKQQPDIEMLSADGVGKDGKLTCDGVCLYPEQETTLESKNRSKLTRKLCGLVAFYAIAMIVEIIGGLRANSLAVITDAGHLLTDIAGFLISLLAVWASSWKATSNQSFGYHRIEVLGALLSVQLIWLISGVLVYESIDRFLHKRTEVNGKLMFSVSAFGFMINLVMVLWLGHDHNHYGCMDNHHHHHSEEDICMTTEEEKSSLVVSSPHDNNIFNINLQGAHLHAMADLIQSIGVMIAGAVIWIQPNWLLADLICTLVFSILVLWTTISMLKNIFSILMNQTPREIDVASLESGLRNIGGVQDIHDLHVWAITVGKSVLTCHVIATPEAASSDILHSIKDFCETVYGIHHMTVQIE